MEWITSECLAGCPLMVLMRSVVWVTVMMHVLPWRSRLKVTITHVRSTTDAAATRRAQGTPHVVEHVQGLRRVSSPCLGGTYRV